MAHRVAVLVAGTFLAALLPAAAAHAATGSPPVTRPDRVAVRAGEDTFVDVTTNDSDADGDALQVCRLGPDVPRPLRESSVQYGQLVVAADRRARGTYTLTYYACDQSYLTPGTVTVKVRPPAPTLDAIPLGDGLPGRIRLVNTFKNRTFHCVWHPSDSDNIEGKVTVPSQSAVVIRVDEVNVQIDCDGGNYGASFIFGRQRVVHRTW